MKMYNIEKKIIKKTVRVTKSTGVSIITCTNKLYVIENILNNYKRQEWSIKELIIIINNNEIDISDWKVKLKTDRSISIYKIDEKKTLGHCLNFGIRRSKYDYIAKFDDDDFYGEKYLRKLMPLFNYTDAHIVGKKSFFVYFKVDNTLILKFPECEKKQVSHLAGATLVIDKEVFKKVKFSEKIVVGSDSDFCKNCTKQGFKLYSGNRFDYVCIRNSDKNKHTWKIDDKDLFAYSIKIVNTENFMRYIKSS